MIVAAAIKTASGLIFTLPPPAGHGNILQHMADAGIPRVVARKSTQGFLAVYADSDRAEFMNRHIAASHALYAGQIFKTIDELHSEDIW